MTREELLYMYAAGERDFSGVDLSGTDLRWADLRWADLSGTDLTGADLTGANLAETNLSGADLSGADLTGANLLRSILYMADLTGANLTDTKLSGANLSGAVTRGTVLDPVNTPNAEVSAFREIRDRNNTTWCIGYRTSNSPNMSGPPYLAGELREAPIFSTAPTDCHPGIFVCPTLEDAKDWGDDVVKVIFRPEECHRAGGKWRVRWLIVLGGV